jgi:hypothetical protein
MSFRIMLIAGLVLLGLGCSYLIVPAQNAADKQWKHSRDSLILGQFVQQNGRLYLYTMDSNPTETGEFSLACWEMPSLRLTNKRPIEIPLMDLQQGFVIPSPHLGRQPWLIIAGTVRPALPPTSVVYLIDLPRAEALPEAIPDRYIQLLSLDDNHLILIDRGSLQTSKLALRYYSRQDRGMRLQHEWSVPIAVLEVLYGDLIDGRIRLIYQAMPDDKTPKGEKKSSVPDDGINLFALPSSIRACYLDVEKGKVTKDEVLHNNSTYPWVAVNPADDGMYLFSGSEMYYHKRNNLTLERAMTHGLLKLYTEREKDRVFSFPYIVRMDSQGKFIASVTNPLGELVVLEASTGRIRFRDDRHLRWVERALQQVDFPLAGLWMRILDVAFIPGEKTLLVAAGTGHVYYYDAENGKLLRVAHVREGLKD